MTSHSLVKVSLLQTLHAAHDYDTICLSEIFLDSSTSDEDEILKVTIFYGRTIQVTKREVFILLYGTRSYYKKGRFI